MRLERCYQRPGEAVKAFADRFLQDSDRAGRAEDGALVYQFIQRMQPDLREEVLRAKPQSIDAAVDFANYWVSARGIFNTKYQDINEYKETYKPSYQDRPTARNNAPDRRPQYEQRRAPNNTPAPRAAGFRDMPSRPERRPYNSPPLPKPAAVPFRPDIEELTKSFKRLELNLPCWPPSQSPQPGCPWPGHGSQGRECGTRHPEKLQATSRLCPQPCSGQPQLCGQACQYLEQLFATHRIQALYQEFPISVGPSSMEQIQAKQDLDSTHAAAASCSDTSLLVMESVNPPAPTAAAHTSDKALSCIT